MSSLALRSNVASLKTEEDKIDADKLKTVQVDLAKLSNVLINDVVKKTEYNKLSTSLGLIANYFIVYRLSQFQFVQCSISGLT